MPGRPKIFNEQDVIEKATALFWDTGYEASSTEDLLNAMGIGKGSFYLAFKGGKQELFEKVLEQFNQQGLARFRKDLDASDDPVEVIRDFFRGIALAPGKAHRRGCFLGNTVAELSNTNMSLMNKASTFLKQLEALFHEVIFAAQQDGRLKNQEDPLILARYLITLWNGLSITRRMYPDNTALAPLIEYQLKVLT